MNNIVINMLPALIPLILSIGGWLIGSFKLNGSGRKFLLNTILLSISAVSALLTVKFATNFHQYGATLFSHNTVNLIMLLLVSFMTIVLIKFSQRYLAGEKDEAEYWRWLLLSLASVSVTIISDHLLLLWLGWLCISLCFHRLLLFYPDRPRATLAAHKKFILARLAEMLLLAAFVLLYMKHDTFQLSTIVSFYVGDAEGLQLDFIDKLAATFIAITALIKCAQLPVHGWLIQVVEAPTPISALLHAGIINLGGFLLISFAPLISNVPAAQWLIIIIAGLSTIISALVMMTRISIKVRLAWSTCAQMGLMLIECALGHYQLAMLHLLAHSVYKAYAFLSAGEAVRDHSLSTLTSSKNDNAVSALAAISLALLSTAGLVIFTDLDEPVSMWLLANTALAMFLVSAIRHGGFIDWLSALFKVSVLISFYVIGKTIISQILPPLAAVKLFDAMDIWLCFLFVLLFALSMLMHIFSQKPLTRAVYRWLYSGLYLDEAMTRLTLQLWPVRLRPESKAISGNKSTEECWV